MDAAVLDGRLWRDDVAASGQLDKVAQRRRLCGSGDERRLEGDLLPLVAAAEERRRYAAARRRERGSVTKVSAHELRTEGLQRKGTNAGDVPHHAPDLHMSRLAVCKKKACTGTTAIASGAGHEDGAILAHSDLSDHQPAEGPRGPASGFCKSGRVRAAENRQRVEKRTNRPGVSVVCTPTTYSG